MASKVPFVTLSDGNKCPILGLGTWQSKPGEVTQAVMDAIDIGYRHFDCAHVYQNEQEVGKALEAKLAARVVKREDLFITSKLWNTYHKKELIEPALQCTLKNLSLSYLDLYLVHWPMGFKEGDEFFAKDSNGKQLYSESHFTETWKGMEECVKRGLVKSIGLSNFNSQQIKEVMEIAEVKPVMNQVECHIHLNQEKLHNFCRQYNIILTAYRPLGLPQSTSNACAPMKDPKVMYLAEKYCKTPAQILLRFQIERGFVAIPKSVNKNRLQSNIDIFDFEICEEDIELLKNLNMNLRLVPNSNVSDHKDYPFNLEF